MVTSVDYVAIPIVVEQALLFILMSQLFVNFAFSLLLCPNHETGSYLEIVLIIS